MGRISAFLEKVIPSIVKRKELDQKLLELYEKGKYLRVGEDIDNKELMENE